MNQSRVGVSCLRAKILGKCRREGNKDRLALAELCMQTLPVGGVVVLNKIQTVTEVAFFFFSCLVHITLSGCVCVLAQSVVSHFFF
jgi:hypothetical protein